MTAIAYITLTCVSLLLIEIIGALFEVKRTESSLRRSRRKRIHDAHKIDLQWNPASRPTLFGSGRTSRDTRDLVDRAKSAEQKIKAILLRQNDSISPEEWDELNLYRRDLEESIGILRLVQMKEDAVCRLP